jgi:hypothetical protein
MPPKHQRTDRAQTSSKCVDLMLPLLLVLLPLLLLLLLLPLGA